LEPTNDFEMRVAGTDPAALFALDILLLEVNLGRRCNLACFHCHHSSGPDRAETMPPEVVADVLALARRLRPALVDLTGGAPELHPDIRGIVASLAADGLAVQLRTNLCVMLEPGLEDLPALLAKHRVRLLASLPGDEAEVTRQRGAGTFERAVEALRRLNALGYASDDALRLDLVANPGDVEIPRPDPSAEEALRASLAERGARFGRLLAVTNTPVGRYRERLEREGGLAAYYTRLRDAFNPATLPCLSCRHQIEVAWDGRVWDCDYNLAAGVAMQGPELSAADVEQGAIDTRRIAFADHCFSCAAASGSS
jgi:radical SAM/Cys-rich protein